MTEETKATKEYEFHPIADLFPKLDPDSIGFKALIEDIKANRQYEPVYLLDGKILDGRNRYLACQHLGREVQTRDYVGTDPIAFVLSINLHRRHLNTSQRAMVAAKLANLAAGANQHSEGTSIDVASKLLNVGRASVDRARKVLAAGDPSLIEQVEQGQTSVTDAAATATATDTGTGNGPDEPDNPKEPDPAVAYKIIDKLIAALTELRDCDAETAMAAASHVVRLLQGAGFLKKKAA